jgi:sodium transport system permease protein
LLTPVSRGAVALGKWLAASALGLCGALVTVVVAAAILRAAPGMTRAPGLWEIAAALAVTLPLAFFAGGLQLLVALSSKSFKEAQTYLSLLLFLPMGIGLLSDLYPLPARPWMAAVPLLGQQHLLTESLAGSPGAAAIVTAGAAAILGGLACVYGAARLLASEKIVLGA